MTSAEISDVGDRLERALERAEARLTAMVNERNTRVIDATTVIVQALHEELQANTEAIAALSGNISARRASIDARLDAAEARLTELEDHVPGAALPPGRAPLRAELAHMAEAQARDRRAALLAIVILALLEALQWLYLLRAP